MMQTCSDTDDHFNYITLLSSVLSLISTLISIFIYFILPNLKKNKALRLITYLLASNAISSLGCFGAVAVSTSISSLMWLDVFSISYIFGFYSGINLTLIFSLNLYFEVYHKKNLLEFQKLIIFSSFGISGIVAILAVFLFKLNQIFIVFFTIYIISVTTVTIGLYIKVIVAFKQISYPQAMQCMKDLAIYPLVGIFMMFLFCSQQILFFMQGCYSTYYLIFIGIRGLQGFIDAIIYGFNLTVRAEIYKTFCRRQRLNIDVPIFDDSKQDILPGDTKSI